MPSNINNLNTSQTITSTQFQTSPSKSNIQENAAAQTGILGKSETNRNMTISYGNNKTRKPIGQKPNHTAPKPQKRTHESQETSRLNESPKLNLTDASEPSEDKTNNQLEEPNTTLVNALNKITGSLKYKTTLRSSKRRQMVLNALNQETQKTINSSTLSSILRDKNCSRGVKTALLLSDKVSLAQKQTILKNNSVEILAYAKAHEILDQVAYYSVGGMMSNTSMTKTEALTTAVFDKNGKFDISHCEEGLKTFFNPTMFTTEERKTIEGQLKEKKIKNPQTDADKFNNFKIDMMIAQFKEPWDASITEQNKVYNKLMDDLITYVETNIPAEESIPAKKDTLNREILEEKLKNIKTITQLYNTFVIDDYDNKGPIDLCNVICVAQVLPRLDLFAKDLIKNSSKASYILTEMKNVQMDEEHTQKVVFIAKKCSEFIKANRGKTQVDFFGEKVQDSSIVSVANLTKNNAEAVTKLAETLGYKDLQ